MTKERVSKVAEDCKMEIITEICLYCHRLIVHAKIPCTKCPVFEMREIKRIYSKGEK